MDTFSNAHESPGSTMQSLLPLVEVPRGQRHRKLIDEGTKNSQPVLLEKEKYLWPQKCHS